MKSIHGYLQMRTLLFKQPAGLGDIFFLQKIAKKAIKQQWRVLWPIIPEFEFLSEYLDNGIVWKSIYEVNEYPLWQSNKVVTNEFDDTIIPFQTADQLFPDELIMVAKYKLVEEDWEDWADHFTWKRNEAKEQTAYNKYVHKESYSVSMNWYGSPPGQKQVTTPKCDVELGFDPDFTPFDYAKIFENAKELHFVDTCYTYMFEKLTLKTDAVYIYNRNPEESIPSWTQTQSLFKKPFRFVHI